MAFASGFFSQGIGLNHLEEHVRHANHFKKCLGVFFYGLLSLFGKKTKIQSELLGHSCLFRCFEVKVLLAQLCSY